MGLGTDLIGDADSQDLVLHNMGLTSKANSLLAQ